MSLRYKYPKSCFLSSNYLEIKEKIFDGCVCLFLPPSTGDFMHGIGEEVYYFTPRHKASGCRANRNAGQGFWHGNGRDQLIFDDESSELIGHKTSLVFRLSDSKRKRLHPNWIMHEYLLHSPDGKVCNFSIFSLLSFSFAESNIITVLRHAWLLVNCLIHHFVMIFCFDRFKFDYLFPFNLGRIFNC